MFVFSESGFSGKSWTLFKTWSWNYKCSVFSLHFNWKVTFSFLSCDCKRCCSKSSSRCFSLWNTTVLCVGKLTIFCLLGPLFHSLIYMYHISRLRLRMERLKCWMSECRKSQLHILPCPCQISMSLKYFLKVMARDGMKQGNCFLLRRILWMAGFTSRFVLISFYLSIFIAICSLFISLKRSVHPLWNGCYSYQRISVYDEAFPSWNRNSFGKLQEFCPTSLVSLFYSSCQGPKGCFY